MHHQPKAYIFAGANASGKSTIVSFLLENRLIEGVYINADLILKEELKLEENTANYIQAFRVQAKRVEECITNKRDIVVEIVTSKNVVRKLKEAGYYITYIFVGTETPKINAVYLAQRVSEGGHDVLMKQVIRRWKQSLENLQAISNIVDCLILIDNSLISKPPRLLASFFQNKLCYINEGVDISKIRWIETLTIKKEFLDTSLQESESYRFCQVVQQNLEYFTDTLKKTYQQKNVVLSSYAKIQKTKKRKRNNTPKP